MTTDTKVLPDPGARHRTPAKVLPDSGVWHRNPVFVLIWALPAAAVLAGIATLFIALEEADRALPASYHWEGARLDADFERARRAAQLGIVASFDLSAGAGRCSVTLEPAVDADVLELRLTHGSDAGLDRMLRLTREDDGVYRSACTPAPRGRWRVALADAAGSWALRGAAEGPPSSFDLRARAPEGPGS